MSPEVFTVDSHDKAVFTLRKLQKNGISTLKTGAVFNQFLLIIYKYKPEWRDKGHEFLDSGRKWLVFLKKKHFLTPHLTAMLSPETIASVTMFTNPHIIC